MLAVHLPGLRLVTPTERPPAPTSMLMPTAWSRLSTTLPMTSTDSVSRAPTFPLLALLPPSSMESRLLPLSSPVSRHPLLSLRESRSLIPRRSLPPRLPLPRPTPLRRLPSLLPLLRGRGALPRLLPPAFPCPTPTASSPLWPLPPLPPLWLTLPTPPLRSLPLLPLPMLLALSLLLLLPPPGRLSSPPSI